MLLIMRIDFTPTADDMQVCGCHAAAIRAEREFHEAAATCAAMVEDLRSTAVREHKHRLLPMEWCFVLQRCIQALLSERRDDYVDICRAAGLLWLRHRHRTSPVSMGTVTTFTQRSADDLLDFIARRLAILKDSARPVCTDKRKNACDTIQIAQLWALLDLSGFSTDGYLSVAFLDEQLSAQDSMDALGPLLEIQTEPAPLSNCPGDAQSVADCIEEELQRSTTKHKKLQAVLSLGFPRDVEEVLPADLLESLPYQVVDMCLADCMELFNLTTDSDRSVALSRFLAEYACNDNAASNDYAAASLRMWMTSASGIRHREDLTVTLCETDNTTTIMACMTALALYARTTGPDEGDAVADAALSEEDYFVQFMTSCAWRRTDANMASTATPWQPEFMAASLWRAVSAPCSSSVPIVGLRWLSSIADMSIVADDLSVDVLCDHYWQERLMGRTHMDSLRGMAVRFWWCAALQRMVA